MLWEKAARLAVLAAATVASGATVGRLRDDASLERRRLRGGARRGVRGRGGRRRRARPGRSMGDHRGLARRPRSPPTARDARAGRPTELDAITGSVVRAGSGSASRRRRSTGCSPMPPSDRSRPHDDGTRARPASGEPSRSRARRGGGHRARGPARRRCGRGRVRASSSARSRCCATSRSRPTSTTGSSRSTSGCSATSTSRSTRSTSGRCSATTSSRGSRVLAPLGTLGVGAPGLLVVQTLALAATAPLLYLLAREHGARGWVAAAPGAPLVRVSRRAAAGAARLPSGDAGARPARRRLPRAREGSRRVVRGDGRARLRDEGGRRPDVCGARPRRSSGRGDGGSARSSRSPVPPGRSSPSTSCCRRSGTRPSRSSGRASPVTAATRSRMSSATACCTR